MSPFGSLVLHPTSQLLLKPISSQLPHALILYGAEGVGLHTIAVELSGRHLIATIEPKNVKGDIDHANGTISVETIRQLYEQTRAKHSGERVILIDDADRMSHGAQSAFLKLLEEPSEGIQFILTSHRIEKLLPTIRSRTQMLQIQPVTSEQTLQFIASRGITDQTHRIQLRYVAEGLPAEISRLIDSKELFSQKAAIISDARDFLQADSYKKVLIIQKYRSDRISALQLIDGTIAILRKTLSVKPEIKLVQQMEQLLETRERIQANCNVALQLIRFVL